MRIRKLKNFRAFTQSQRTAEVPQAEKEETGGQHSEPSVCPQLGVDYRDFHVSVNLWEYVEQSCPAKMYQRKHCQSSSDRPDFVNTGRSGQFICDCRGYREVSPCSHCVAVADMLGCLRQLLAWYAKSKKGPSLSELVYRGMPSNPGDKPGQKRRKRTRAPLPRKKAHCVKFRPQSMLEDSCTAVLAVPITFLANAREKTGIG